MIELYRVTKEQENSQIILREINLHIPMGQMVFLIGESGAGKSTLLKVLCKETSINSGRVLIGRVDISRLTDDSQLKRRMSVISQEIVLLPHLNVYDNVAYILRAKGISEKEIRYRVEGSLNVVGLLSKVKELPKHLSGGEKQRIAIARSIVTNPTVLLADEPTAQLDPVNSLKTFQLFKEINERLRMTMLITTHDPRVGKLGKRIVKLSRGEITMDTEPSNLPMFGNLAL